MKNLQPAPAPEEQLITGGLDYYKPTMSQLAYEQYPDAQITFQLINRGQQRLADYVEPTELQAKLDARRAKGFANEELDYLASIEATNGQPVFANDYLNYLNDAKLPPTTVALDPTMHDLTVATTGDWPLATFWETVVMSDLNEMYFENLIAAHGLDPAKIYDQGDERLSQKIAILQQRPDIKFAEFGTRRHFSLKWQKYVLERLVRECPQNLVGTSNVALANSLNLRPIGTYAHELPMAYEGISRIEQRDANPLDSHSRQMSNWLARYPDYDTALTDTFGTDFFLADFAKPDANDHIPAQPWRSVRHDSGDPFQFGDRFINFLRENQIDPLTKTICFSDGLDIATIVQLADYFAGRIKFNFGWGTTLTNDLGLEPLNIVMKATRVETAGGSANLVKLSDSIGKHTGSEETIAELTREKQDFLANLSRNAESFAEPHFDAGRRSRELVNAR